MEKTEEFMEDCNTIQLHGSLGDLSPIEFMKVKIISDNAQFSFPGERGYSHHLKCQML